MYQPLSHTNGIMHFMKPDPLDIREDALSFLVAHETGVLATLSREGAPSARMVYYTCDDSFNVYFITLANTRKVADLQADSRAAFVVAQSDIPRTLQMEGTITELTDTAKIDPTLSEFVHRLMSHKKYGIPLAHLDASELKFFCFTPTWVRLGDFTTGEGTDEVFTEVSPKEA